jgi:hypothetical protein
VVLAPSARGCCCGLVLRLAGTYRRCDSAVRRLRTTSSARAFTTHHADSVSCRSSGGSSWWRGQSHGVDSDLHRRAARSRGGLWADANGPFPPSAVIGPIRPTSRTNQSQRWLDWSSNCGACAVCWGTWAGDPFQGMSVGGGEKGVESCAMGLVQGVYQMSAGPPPLLSSGTASV